MGVFGGSRKVCSFFSATPEERYDFRCLVADHLAQRGLVSKVEWRELSEEAAAAYADELG
ncbi:hypothetical protein TX23_25475 [Pseudomonas paralactis]|uniref:Uncharacterized protein n=1 Tax=Pseudomonas paralactis TaxID=1615673 RepID=A0A0R3A6D3_9PSED|nr:hypothetical protein TX23_25475 [Pseudomonas paralactis]